ncbi:MAG: YraN family protein [Deltaproteobacteria bacterium]|nr:MAG: YraN family protein [Deltaproteobacteria bacterium]
MGFRFGSSRDKGLAGETLAVRYLKKNGYAIQERNYRCPLGEIDIIARTRTHLVFVEVKTRLTPSYGTPEAAVDFQKQRTLSKVALFYLKTHDLLDVRARFDVVAIDGSGDTRPDIHLIENAFEIAYG